MSPTLEDVARIAGVSRSTVSRVVNNHPSVRPEVRERVWRAVRESGYQPHAVARSLVTNRTHILGVLIPEMVTTLFTDPFFPLLLRGATEACNAHKYHLMLSLFNDPASRDEMYARVLGNGYLDGVVVASASSSDPLIPRLLHDGIPFVSVGRHPDHRVHYVDVDNVGGARMAVEHLIRLGHRRIATITGRMDMTAGQSRLEGYRQTLEAHGIPVSPELIAEGDFSEEGGRIAMERLLPARPTAVFVASDMMAMGAMKAIREAGLRVPDDIAVVGFDDLSVASLVEPPLTTIRQPVGRLGVMAVEMLIGLLEGTITSPQHVVLPVQLILRASCGSL